MTPELLSVRSLVDYQLEAGFANGKRRLFDMRHYFAYQAFVTLAEGGLFMRAHVALDTAAWTDETDLWPDTRYLRGTPVESAGAPDRDGACNSVANG